MSMNKDPSSALVPNNMVTLVANLPCAIKLRGWSSTSTPSSTGDLFVVVVVVVVGGGGGGVCNRECSKQM
jgi:hypothetical protein